MKPRGSPSSRRTNLDRPDTLRSSISERSVSRRCRQPPWTGKVPRRKADVPHDVRNEASSAVRRLSAGAFIHNLTASASRAVFEERHMSPNTEFEPASFLVSRPKCSCARAKTSDIFAYEIANFFGSTDCYLNLALTRNEARICFHLVHELGNEKRTLAVMPRDVADDPDKLAQIVSRPPGAERR